MIVASLIAFLVAASFSFFLVKREFRALMDEPGSRSLHHVPVPRSGGIAICCGMVVGALCSRADWEVLFDPYLLAGVVILWLVSVLDDIKPLGQFPRLVCQCLAAALVVFIGQLFFRIPNCNWLWPVLGVLAVLWGVNLYNFMDGMDGFAAGMAIFGFSTVALIGFQNGDTALASLCMLVVASNLGFLVFNFPPARIFMGDSGSTVMGYLMVTISLLGWKRGLYPVWVPLVIFSPFWVDASVTLLKRGLSGKKIWQAHREHYYQRWVLAGYSHRRVVLLEYCLMASCSASVVAWQLSGAGYNGMAVPAVWTVFYILLMLWSDKVLRTCQTTKQ
jgi:UDP-N-acetylmuramyl pentapeptide phosphotransferase/UDP-N-acetylglucosamine-1-phosphate transferase